MFILSSFTSWCTTVGYQYYWSRICKVGENDNFCCEVLDTDDMSNERFSRQELEELLSKCPSVKIERLNHDKGKITGIYHYHGGDCQVVGDYALITESFTDGGNYLDCKLYKRGIGRIHQWHTPCYEYYHWDTELKVHKNIVTVVEKVVKHYDGRDDLSFDMVIVDDNKGLRVIKKPSQEEVNQGYQYISTDEVYFNSLINSLSDISDKSLEKLCDYLLRLRKGTKINIIGFIDKREVHFLAKKTGGLEYTVWDDFDKNESTKRYLNYKDLGSYIRSHLYEKKGFKFKSCTIE